MGRKYSMNKKDFKIRCQLKAFVHKEINDISSLRTYLTYEAFNPKTAPLQDQASDSLSLLRLHKGKPCLEQTKM